MEKLKKVIIYFVIFSLLLFPGIISKVQVKVSFALGLFLSIMIVLAISLSVMLIEPYILKSYKNIKKLKKESIYFLCCILCVFILAGSKISNVLMNRTILPQKVLLEVVPNNGEANGNIWVTSPNMNVEKYSGFSEIEKNHFISEAGVPWMEINVFNVKESNIIISCDNKSSKVRISFDGHSKEYDCYSSVPQQKTICLLYYDGLSFWRIFLYCLSGILCAVLVYVLIALIRTRLNKGGWKQIKSFFCLKVTSKNLFIIFLSFWGLFIIYDFINFDFIKSYLENGSGDTVWYWHVGSNIFLPEGGISIKNFIAATDNLAFRGYLPMVIFAILKFISERLLKVEALYVCFIFLSFMASFLNNILLPSIHKIINKNMDIYIWQLIILNGCFFAFLRGHILWPMSDLMSFFFIVCGGCCFLKFLENEQCRYLYGNVLFITCGILCRRNYAILFYLELIWLVVWLRKRKLSLRYIIKVLSSVVIGIFCISGPQILINYMRNGGLEYLGGSMNNFAGSQSLTESSIQLSLDEATQAWPYFLKNAIGGLMKDTIYPGMEELKLIDFMYIFASHPLESISFIISKLFMALDIRTAWIYPKNSIDLGVYGIGMLLFNALIWSGVCLSVYGKTMINECYKKGEKILWLIVILFLVFPLLVVHIEWRYFIACYYMAYYSFCFCLPRWLLKADKEVKKDFLIHLIVLMAIFIIISINNYGNLCWNNPGGIIF